MITKNGHIIVCEVLWLKKVFINYKPRILVATSGATNTEFCLC